jgi:hypothetical protein
MPVDATEPVGAENDKRAVASFVLGLLSFVTCGLTSIPAVGLGIRAREAIDASGGRLRGTALAAAGIATGACGAFTSVVVALAFVAGVYLGGEGVIPLPTAPAGPHDVVTLWTRAPSAQGAGQTGERSTPLDSTSPHRDSDPANETTIDLAARETFQQQLRNAYDKATTEHRMLVVMTSAQRCSVCREIDDSLDDAKMQTALAHVLLVRVDVNAFDEELRASGMFEETLPWFYKLDAGLRPTDAISAGEWDENTPENIAPVLGSFFAGTLHTRRDPSGALGVSL